MTVTAMILLALLQSPAPANVPQDRPRLPATDVLSRLTEEALGTSPSLQQIAARISAAKARIRQAKAWPDPTVTVVLSNVPFNQFSFDASPMTGVEVMVMQMFPYLSRLRLGAAMAETKAEALGEKLQEARLMLGLMVRTMALDLAEYQAMADVMRIQGKLLDRVIEASLGRYRTQASELTEVLLARQSRTQIDAELEKIAGQREQMEARINTLIGRASDRTVPTPLLTEARPLPRGLEALIAEAREHRPMLREMRRKLHMEELNRRMIRTEFWPEFSVTLGYRFGRENMGSGPRDAHFWSVGLGIKLPIWSIGKTRASLLEADALIAAEAHGLRASEREVERQIRTARDALLRLDRRLTLLDQRLLPVARRGIEAALSAYVATGQGFLIVLEQRRMLIEMELEVVRLRVQRAQMWQALRAAVGDGGRP